MCGWSFDGWSEGGGLGGVWSDVTGGPVLGCVRCWVGTVLGVVMCFVWSCAGVVLCGWVLSLLWGWSCAG